MVVLGGVAVSHERGTPIGVTVHSVDYEDFVGVGFRGVTWPDLHYIRPESQLREAS